MDKMKALPNIAFGDLRPCVIYSYNLKYPKGYVQYIPKLGDYGLWAPSSCAWMVPGVEVEEDF